MRIPMYMYGHIALNSSSNDKFFRKLCRENRNTNFIFNSLFENRAFYEVMWKIWRMRLCVLGI